MLRWIGIVGLIVVMVVAVGGLASRFALDVSGISSFRVTPNVILPPIPFVSEAAADSQPDESQLDPAGLNEPPGTTPPEASTNPQPIEKQDEGGEALESKPVEEVENVEQDGPTNEPEKMDPTLENPEQSEQDDAPKDEPTLIDDDAAVSEPVNTDPPAKEPDGLTEDEDGTDTEKSGPQEDELSSVKGDEQADPQEGEDQAGTEEQDVPVEQPHSDSLEVDSPVEQDEPDEDDTVSAPATTLPRQEQDETVDRGDAADEPETPEPPVNEPEDIQEEAPVVEPETTEPVLDESEVEPEEPVVEPPEVVEEQPEEVESCLVDVELRLTPELLDINAEVDEVLLQVRFPGSMARAARDLASVEVWVQLDDGASEDKDDDLYGDLMVEAIPDAEQPRAGEFELALEQMVYLLNGTLGEVTLEVRGALDECEFTGTDTFEVIATPEPAPEPVVEESQEQEVAVDETGAGDPGQTEPVEDGQQEQTESVEGDAVEQPENTAGDPQDESDPVEGKEESVETSEGEGDLDPDDDETGEPEGVE